MIGLVTGVCLGGVGGGASTFCTFVLGSSLGASVVLSAEAVAAVEDWDAATRCNALPSLRSLVIKFSRCNFAEGRVMLDSSNDSISSASESRSVALFVVGDVV